MQMYVPMDLKTFNMISVQPDDKKGFDESIVNQQKPLMNPNVYTQCNTLICDNKDENYRYGMKCHNHEHD